MGYVLKTSDGQDFEFTSFEFRIKKSLGEKIGDITFGNFGTGDRITTNEDGIYIFRTDGTKQFINYSWFK